MAITAIIVVVGIIYSSISLYIINKFDMFSYSFDFIMLSNVPFYLSNQIMHAKIGDRQLIEQGLETIVTGYESKTFQAGIKNFLEKYELNYYNAYFTANDKEYLNVGKEGIFCGANDDGICTEKQGEENCGVGRIEINDNGKCFSTEACCRQNIIEYEKIGKYGIFNCGSDDVGICTEGVSLSYIVNLCPPSMTSIDDEGKCKDANEGKTPVCCADMTDDTKYAQTAETPLFFKKYFGYMVVTAK